MAIVRSIKTLKEKLTKYGCTFEEKNRHIEVDSPWGFGGFIEIELTKTSHRYDLLGITDEFDMSVGEPKDTKHYLKLMLNRLRQQGTQTTRSYDNTIGCIYPNTIYSIMSAGTVKYYVTFDNERCLFKDSRAIQLAEEFLCFESEVIWDWFLDNPLDLEN